MTITQTKLEELAVYYDHTDLSDSIERAERNDEAAVSPMVTTSLRLPVELMEAIRVQAAAQRVRPTALMRRWVEDAATGQTGAVAKAVQELSGVVLEIRNALHPVGRSTPRPAPVGRARKAPPRTATAKTAAIAAKTGTQKAAPTFVTTKVAAKKASTQAVTAKKATAKKATAKKATAKKATAKKATAKKATARTPTSKVTRTSRTTRSER